MSVSDLVEAAIKVGFLSLVATLLALAMRRTSASERSLAVDAALAILLVAPFLAAVLPPLTIRVSQARQVVDHREMVATISQSPRTKIDDPELPKTRVAAKRAPAETPSSVLFYLYAYVTLGFLASLLASLARLEWIRRRACPVRARTWEQICPQVCAGLGYRMPVRILTSADIGAPVSFGLLRPVVIIDEWTELTIETLTLSVKPGLKVTHQLKIDSGAQESFADAIVAQSVTTLKTRGGNGLGENFVAASGLMDAVQLGPFAFRKVWGPSATPPAMGMEILRRFIVTFDAPHGRLYLSPTPAIKEPIPAPEPEVVVK